MKKIISMIASASMILSTMTALTVSVSAETAYRDLYRQAKTDDTWVKLVTDAASDASKWTFVSGSSEKPGWALYTDYNKALLAEKTGKGVHSNITSLPRNPRGRTGIYHKSIQSDTGGRILQFTGGSYKNFAVTFDIQAVNTWNEEAGRASRFDFGLIDEALPVKELQTDYSGQNYVRMDGTVDMQALTLPSGAAGEEISPRAAVINTQTAADYPGAEVVTKTDSVTGEEYIESVTENGKTTYWNQVINCKVVVINDVISIYMKFEDADKWKKIESYGIPNNGFGKINKRFYFVCSGFQSLVSNVDIWENPLEFYDGEAVFEKTDGGYTVKVPYKNHTGAALTSILASYKESGSFENAVVFNAATGDNTAEFNVLSTSDNPAFRLFTWNDTNDMTPLTDALVLAAD